MWKVFAAIVFIQLARVSEAVQGTCPYYVAINDGTVTYSDPTICNKAGGTMCFTCDDGFQLVGDSCTTCLPNGNWDKPIPTCNDVRCPVLRGLQNGKIDPYCRKPGCLAVFTCDPGWVLSGSDPTCNNKQWNPAVPTCVENWCPLITTIKHGRIVGYQNPPVVGTYLVLVCDDGFEFKNGEQFSTCLSNRQWSYDLACVCGNNQAKCDAASDNCPTVVSIPFGSHEVKDLGHGKRAVKITSCNVGYGTPTGTPKFAKCTDGQYSNIPECKYIRCPHIEYVEGGTVSPTVQYSTHDRIQITCDRPEYHRMGSPGLQCREHNVWGPGMFSCAKMVCPHIPPIECGKVKGSYSNTIHSRVYFECHPGCKLVGHKSVRCACAPGKPPAWRFQVPKCVPEPPSGVCDDIDIVFVLDSSGSLTFAQFEDIKNFVKDIIGSLSIGQNKARVGVIIYGVNAQVVFNLKKHNNVAPAAAEVMAINHLFAGQTRTDRGIDEALKMCMDCQRPGVPCIGVVLTDAQSTNPSLTQSSAEAAQQKITLVAVGVLGASVSELETIASGADSTNVFLVDDTADLKMVVQDITLAACEEVCDDIDLVFVIDSSGSISNDGFMDILDFVKDVISRLDIGPSKGRVGLIKFGYSAIVEFDLKKHTTAAAAKADVMNTVHIRAGTTNTASGLVALRNMCASCARFQNGARVPCVGILLTDGRSSNMAATAAEATTTHNVPINVISVGVGNAIQSELETIASGPNDNNVFTVAQTDELENTVDGIINQACKQGCDDVDLVFAMDGSGSINSNEFDDIKDFIVAVIQQIVVCPHKARVGLICFGSNAVVEFDLKKHLKANTAIPDVLNTVKKGGGTNTAAAINEIGKMCKACARTEKNVPVPCVGVVITDGGSNDRPATRAAATKARDECGVVLVAVGIGFTSAADKQELRDIASGPGDTNVCEVGQTSELKTKVNDIIDAACNPGCDDIDLVFIIDASGSISGPDFASMLNFVVAVVGLLDIGQDKARVGLICFATDALVQFDLDKYGAGDNAALEADILDTIRFGSKGSGTLTHLGIIKFRDVCALSPRAGTPCVGIVMTDGQSNFPGTTKQEADNTNHMLIAIGTGGANQAELNNIATGPGESNTFKVGDVQELFTAVTEIVDAACNPGCDDIDLVFAIDASGSIDTTEFASILQFVVDVVNSLDIGQNKARVALICYATNAEVQFDLDMYDAGQEAALIADINDTPRLSTKGRLTATDKGIVKIREMCDQSTRPCVGIVVTDGRSNNPTLTKQEADATNHVLLAVGVSGALQSELNDIATGPDETNTFKVDDASDLVQAVSQVVTAACNSGN